MDGRALRLRSSQLIAMSDERYVIQYIEPVSRNAAAVGLDIASESNRRMLPDRQC